MNAAMILLAFVNVISSLTYAFKVNTAKQFLNPDQYYGQWFYTLWITSLFCLFSRIKINNNIIQKIVMKLSSNTFFVYLGHIPIIFYITSIYQLNNIGMALLLVVVLFLFLELFAEIFRKIPLLRKLI